MNREYHRWYSQRLQREMELLVVGHSGAKVLVFPTRDGRFHEYEDLHLVHSVASKIEAGHLQLWCVDSIDWESFYCFWNTPADRIRRHMLFEEYILHEVMPLMHGMNPHPCTIAHGCSLGAYHAANIAFRHPDKFQKLVALSGRYDLTLSVDVFHDLLNGHYDENVYFNTPTHFLPNLRCDWHLEHLRRMDMVIVVGADDPFLDNNRYLSAILDAKGLSHRLHVWEGRAHRASCWRKMAPLYL
ncbi:esterase family protein [Propionivibrio sp.]|uniref:esterase family protein n=1 Tax=Propionivibrio sp. TaxID=2212460 RepID=UPI003BEF9C19